MSDSPTPKSIPPLDDQRLHELIQIWESTRGQQKRPSAIELCPHDSQLARRLQAYMNGQTDGDDFDLDVDSVNELQSIGPFEVVRFIGRGGSSDVFLCEQERPKRDVALKLLKISHCDKRFARRFQVEIELLATLEHAGIARIYEAGEADIGRGPQPYYTMEYVDGLRLDHFLEVASPADFSVDDRVRLFLQIASAVSCAHEQGIVHRDLKPSNLLVSKRDEIKVIDFGLARSIDSDSTIASMTQAGHFVGTPLYMSPEQFHAEKHQVDTRSDIYSLGVVLYQMLVGHLPYDLADKTLIEIANTVMQQQPLAFAPQKLGGRTGLDLIVMKMLEKDPGDRYQTLHSVMTDLRNYLDGMPLTVKPPSVLEPVIQWRRRNPRLAALSSIATVVLAVSLAVSLMATFTAHSRTSELRLTLKELAERSDEADQQRFLAEDRAEKLGKSNEELRRTRDRLRRSTSNATLLRASQIAETNPQQAQSMLLDTLLIPESFRAFAWDLIWHQSSWIERKDRWTRGPVVALAISGDGERYAAAAIGGIEVRRMDDFSLVFSKTDHIEHPTILALDFRGTRLVYRKPDDSLVSVTLPGDEKTTLIPRPAAAESRREWVRPTSLAWSESGRLAIGYQDGWVHLIDENQHGNQLKFAVGQRSVAGMRFDEERSILATATFDGVFQTNDLRDGQGIESYKSEAKGLQRVVFDPTLRYVTGGRRFHYVAEWDCREQKRIFFDDTPGPFVAMAPISGGNGGFALATRSRLRIAYPDRDTAFVQLAEDSIRAVAVTPDGTRVLSGDGAGNLTLFRSRSHRSPRLRKVEAERVRSLRFLESVGGVVVCGVDAPLEILNLDGTSTDHSLPSLQSPITDVEPSQDGSLLFYSALDGSLGSWSLKSGSPGPLQVQGEQRIVDLAVQDSTRLIALMRRGNIVQFAIPSGNMLRDFDAHQVRGSALLVSHFDNRLYSADEQGMIKSWNLQDLDSESPVKPIRTVSTGTARVHGLAIDPTGRFLAAASSDGQVRIYSADELVLVKELDVHTGPARSVDFAPDGVTLASGGMDNRLVLTDTASWQVQFERKIDCDGIRSVRFSPDGNRLAVGGNFGSVALFETSEPKNREPISALEQSAVSKANDL